MTDAPSNLSNWLPAAVAATIALALPAAIEIPLAMPVPGRVYLVYGAVCILLMTPLLLGRPRAGKLVVAALFVALLAVLWAVPWTERKVFLRDFVQIRPGMTPAEVKLVMKGYRTGTGWPDLNAVTPGMTTAGVEDVGELEIQGAMVFRHHDDRFNSDWGVVYFDAANRVERIQFMPD